MLTRYLEGLGRLGPNPSENQIIECADKINDYLKAEGVDDDAKEDPVKVISVDLKNPDESIIRTFRKVYDYVKNHPYNYNVSHFDLINDHFKKTPTHQYKEADTPEFANIDLRKGTGEVKLENATFSEETADKIRKTFNELARIWEDYEANLDLEIEKREMVLVKNDPSTKAELEKKLTDFDEEHGNYIKIFNWGRWNSDNRAKETIAREFVTSVETFEKLEEKRKQDKELQTLLEKRDKVEQLRGYLNTNLVGRGGTQFELTAILKTEKDLDSEETKKVLGTHRTNSWVRSAYNIISVLLAGIAAAIRAGASYHKYGTARFYLPKSEKLSMQSKDLIEKTKKILPDEVKSKFGKQK